MRMNTRDCFSHELSAEDTATILVALRYWVKAGGPVTPADYKALRLKGVSVHAADNVGELVACLAVQFETPENARMKGAVRFARGKD